MSIDGPYELVLDEEVSVNFKIHCVGWLLASGVRYDGPGIVLEDGAQRLYVSEDFASEFDSKNIAVSFNQVS